MTQLKATSKNSCACLPVGRKAGIQNLSELPPEFTPYWIRGGGDKLLIIRDSFKYSRLFISGAIALIVAIADEINQSFIPTRDASITDVLLDAVGIVLMLFLITQLYKRKHRLSDLITQ